MTTNLLLIALLLLVLLIPYAWDVKTDFLGRRSGYLRAALYTYRFSPGFARLEFHGLQRLQAWLLLIVTTAAAQLQPDLINRLVALIRQALGL